MAAVPSQVRAIQTTLVVMPFRQEDPEIAMLNLGIAASHPSVGQVLAVAGDHDPTTRVIVEGAQSGSVKILTQERHGRFRSGKGDAVSTGFRFFLEETSFERIHFYDIDIKTFGDDWITNAESALDLGYDAVRHYYPRAATDAMITWMVTRPGFALLWPESELPWLEQPLSGELAFSRSAAKIIASDPLVVNQSDWGIDTAISFSTISHGLAVYESYVSRGKAHALYDTLADIKVMMLECLGALQQARTGPPPQPGLHRVEHPNSVSPAIADELGFDVERTQRLLAAGWTNSQEQLLTRFFPLEVTSNALLWKTWPDTAFMDEARWLETLSILLRHFDLEDPDWCEVAFRLWLGRVLHYTLRIAARGYGYAMSYLHDMIRRSAEFALNSR